MLQVLIQARTSENHLVDPGLPGLRAGQGRGCAARKDQTAAEESNPR